MVESLVDYSLPELFEGRFTSPEMSSYWVDGELPGSSILRFRAQAWDTKQNIMRFGSQERDEDRAFQSLVDSLMKVR